jgi:hypothetical protein
MRAPSFKIYRIKHLVSNLMEVSMRTRSMNKLFFRFGMIVLLALILIAESGITRADDSVIVSIAIDQTVVTIGRTPKLTIDISNTLSHTIRVTRLQCIKSGTSLTSNSINPMPSTIAANGAFRTTQSYKAVSPGTTTIHCELTATNTVTGTIVTASSNSVSVNVLSETRLYFDVTSSSGSVKVGQTVYVTAKFGNRGKTPFTNLSINCIDMGQSLFFVSSTPLQSTILPGQSGFVRYTLQGSRQGGEGLISCQLTATDSSNGQQVTLPAPTVHILVK